MENQDKIVEYLKKVTAELQRTRRRLHDVESERTEPIAVVAMGCRLPGGVSSPEDLWDLLVDGTDALTGFPADRWDVDEVHDPSRSRPGTSHTDVGGFLRDAAGFDAALFGISPREALAMDPQQRILLETAWETFERAGIDPLSVKGGRTGLFIGTNGQDYRDLTREAGAANPHAVIGSAGSVLSGRAAYVFGLQGPAVTVDTACSASLVGVHLAAQALRAGECDLALAGGVTVMSTPAAFVEFSRQGGLAEDGRCKPFAAAADGTGWGEGIGLLLLERLSAAERHGRPILGLIRGSAVNQDGASNGLTAPNGVAQRRVIRAALAGAGLSAADVDVVEAHGTGTRLGDPIEAEALLATYGQGRPRPLLLGSIKSNIGHTQAAAGVAGVIKMLLALRHGVVPASLHAAEPTPRVDWSGGAVELAAGARELPALDRPWRAGVSSFGVSGTNAHVIVEQAPPDTDQDPAPEPVGDPRVSPFPVSGNSAAALRAQSARLREFLLADPGVGMRDLSWSLVTSRAALDHRAVVVAEDREELLSGLADIAAGEPGGGAIGGVARGGGGRTVFVFPGQGSQWTGMGRGLLASTPVFAARMAECAEVLDPLTGWSLIDALDDADALSRVDVVQPATFAVMVSLAAVWESCGITPDAVVGHSQGEVAAAVVGGWLSLEAGARVVLERSRVVGRVLSGVGGMVSAALPEHEAETMLADHPGLSVAAVNGPNAVVVAGERTALAGFVAACGERQIRARWIDVDYASHSVQVDAVLEELRDVLGGLPLSGAGAVPMMSSVTADWVSAGELDGGYWIRNLRGKVRFHDATRALLDGGHRRFVEVSAHPVLSLSLESTGEASGTAATVLATLRRDDGGHGRLLRALAEAWTAGLPVTWPIPAGRRIDLPTYAFQRDAYWIGRAGAPVPAMPVPDEGDTDPAAIPSQWQGLTGGERRARLLDLVRRQAADVLGHASPADIPVDQAFKDMGFESLTAVDFRKRLAAAIGMDLPVTLVFDHPTPAELVKHVDAGLTGRDGRADDPGRRAATGEPIAIVSMACHFPGGAGSPEDLWRLVSTGTDAITGFPTDRGWDVSGLFEPGTSVAHRGGFLDDAGGFDAGLFGISPDEALVMDPQQRLLLETSWELFERAGIDPSSLKGSRTGVFAGMSGRDYAGSDADIPESATGYTLTGSVGSVLSGRLSYVFGLVGPAVTVDTACSSSLVGLHLAVQSLRSGECDLALAGGVTVMATPAAFVEFSRQGGLAADGRCKPFAAGADGTGWGEGAGLVLLERLSDAERNGHRILGIVRGTAVNQDGASNGLTAPNGLSQQRVIGAALASAGLSAGDVDVVEAHGTGTTLGDPIEAQAVLATYGQERDRPVLLGSVKSNIGHTQAAAGVAGVIKMVLALRHGVVPASLHLDDPSPHVDWTTGNVQLTDVNSPLPEVKRPWRAGISAFGVSGTNAHVIVEQAPEESRGASAGSTEDAALPFLVSAKSDEAVRAQAARLRDFLEQRPDVALGDVARSLVSARAALERRAVVVAAGHDELLAGLAALADGTAAANVTTGTARSGGRLAVVFSGQGSERVGMGRELYEAFDVFREAFDEVCGVADALIGCSLRDAVFEGGGDVTGTLSAQLGLFAFEVALFRLVCSWGVEVDAVMGHSLGEIVAAHVAGVFNLSDAVGLVVARGRLMGDAGPGAMAALEASESEVGGLLVDGVEIAAVNGPEAVVVSGDESAVGTVLDRVAERGRRVRRLPVGHGFHSFLMEPVLADFGRAIEGVEFRRPELTLISNVTGGVVADEVGSAEYWVRHVRETVRFADGVSAAVDAGVTGFLELGPDGSLTSLVRGRGDEGVIAAAGLRRERPETATLLGAVAALHVHGLRTDWRRYFTGPSRPVDLPTYPFQRRRYWLEAKRPAGPAGNDARFWELVHGADADAVAAELDVDPGQPLREVLPAVARWQRRHALESAVGRHCYQVSWAPFTGPDAEAREAVFLLVVPAGDARAERLAALFADLPSVVAVPLAVGGDDRAALAERLRRIPGSVTAVLSLLALAEEPVAGSPAVPMGLRATVTLVQALGESGVRAPLWCLTQDAVAAAAGDRVAGTRQATVWGLGAVLALEQPERWGGLVDLPAEVTPDAAAGAARAVLAPGGEDQLAVRDAGVLARRLLPAPAPAAAPLWRPRGTTLITGGTGALGAHVARHLAAQGAEHLVLAGRQGLDAPGAGELRAELTALGARVTVVSCDVADRDALARLIGGLPAEHPLTTVVHAAGALDDAAADALTVEQMDRALRAKLLGARHLHELTRSLDLSAFVLFSSAGATVGALGQANYAPGNAFLDALAAHRRAAGLPATSIAWGPWRGEGMAGALRKVDEVQGVFQLDPDAALLALRRALAQDEAFLLVADMDWRRYQATAGASRPGLLLRDLVAEPAPESGRASASTFRDRFDAASPGERERMLSDLVRTQVAAVLGPNAPASLDGARPFRDLGFDSLAAIELRNRLTMETGLKLPPALAFEQPNPSALAEFLHERLGGTETADPEPEPVLGQLSRLESSLAAVADEELRVTVAARLRALAARFDAVEPASALAKLATGSDDDLLDFIRTELRGT
ncbi:type I polyketide synthase [Actinomadura rugatobispora]|uniref:Type I polyketide synthase n=1 Tax=Actinomadura rugatobispora TaxID=1994 RepID=A0ABW1AD63_9ACTN